MIYYFFSVKYKPNNKFCTKRCKLRTVDMGDEFSVLFWTKKEISANDEIAVALGSRTIYAPLRKCDVNNQCVKKKIKNPLYRIT